ncbi:MAG: class I SAM-dependent DNA methyltransferase, partial [Nitrococcus sp.]|nr:class I SAM-dependent DNA methyltransferase [Nitrococcus sp.]
MKRRDPLADVPPMRYGSKPVDGGHLIFTEKEKKAFLEQEPGSEQYFRPFMGADELLYGYKRWCLWLKNVSPVEWRSLPLVKAQVEAVRVFRQMSKKKPTREMADYPTLFAEDRQPENDYLALPEVSGESRDYLPVALLPSSVMLREALNNSQSWS